MEYQPFKKWNGGLAQEVQESCEIDLVWIPQERSQWILLVEVQRGLNDKPLGLCCNVEHRP
jgi:hypothetical protein